MQHQTLQPLLRMLETRYSIKVPSATDYGKAVASKAALKCTDKEVTTLAKSMSHSIQTHKRYYQGLPTTETAAKAYKARREDTDSLEEETDPQPRPQPKPLPGRCPYTREEEDAISKFFRGTLADHHLHYAGPS